MNHHPDGIVVADLDAFNSGAGHKLMFPDNILRDCFRYSLQVRQLSEFYENRNAQRVLGGTTCESR